MLPWQSCNFESSWWWCRSSLSLRTFSSEFQKQHPERSSWFLADWPVCCQSYRYSISGFACRKHLFCKTLQTSCYRLWRQNQYAESVWSGFCRWICGRWRNFFWQKRYCQKPYIIPLSRRLRWRRPTASYLSAVFHGFCRCSAYSQRMCCTWM